MALTNTAGYAVYHAGPMQEWTQRHAVQHPTAGEIRGKKWLKDELQLTGCETSLGVLPPGAGTPFLHSHKQNEELYLFLTGSGEMLLDGESVAIEAGSSVRVDPPVVRAWRNTSDEVMYYLVIQSKAGSLEQWTRTDGVIHEGEPWPAEPENN